MATQLCGGTGPDKEADDTIKEICNQIKPHVEAKLGREVTHFEPKSYKTQVVAGTNFFVKVCTNPDSGDHLHLRIYRDLQKNISLHSVQEGKAHADPIEYF